MFEDHLQKIALFCAWLIALVAVLISLHSSLILKIPVCDLCWYQRICLYPLALILGIAAYRNDLNIGIYAIPLLVIGAFFALYQYLEQMIPAFNPINFCEMGAVSCKEVTFKLFGFITYPFLNFLASVVMIILLTVAMRRSRGIYL